MGDNEGRGPPVLHFSSTVAPADSPVVQQLYPTLPLDELAQPAAVGTPGGGGPSVTYHRRLPQMPKVNINMPALPTMPNMPSINVPQMMNISSYIPEIKTPAFLKDVYALPVQVGGQINRGVHHIGDNINKVIDRGDVYLHKPPPMPEFDGCSTVSQIYSIISYLFDFGSDAATAYVLWDEPDSTWWFWLTVTLIVVPIFVCNAFSFYWYCTNDFQSYRYIFESRPGFSKCWWFARIIVHILQLGPIFRYIDLLYYGIKSRQSRLQRVNIQGPYCPWPKKQAEIKKQVDYYNLLLLQERDISILELMHSFMQDAPQFILQLYILAKRPPTSKTQNDYIMTVVIQVVSSLSSLISLSWSLMSYQRVLRYATPDKPQLSVGGASTLFFWHTFQVTARVIALALFATAYKQHVFVLIVAHWTLMTSWILAQKTNFCGSQDGKRRTLLELFYNIVVGWIFVFVMISVKAGATRVKYSLYYLLMAGENVAMIVLWFLQPGSREVWYHLPALVATCACFILGLFFMMIYYRKYHPDGRMPNKEESAKLF